MLNITSGWMILTVFIVIYAATILLAWLLKPGIKEKNLSGKRNEQFPPVSLDSNIIELNKIWNLVEEFDHHEIHPKIIFDLHAVLEELFVFIIHNAFDDMKNQTVKIQRTINRKHIVIKIEYPGKEFNILDTPKLNLAKPLEEITLEGLEIHLVKKMVDQIEYQRVDEINRLILKKNTEFQESNST